MACLERRHCEVALAASFCSCESFKVKMALFLGLILTLLCYFGSFLVPPVSRLIRWGVRSRIMSAVAIFALICEKQTRRASTFSVTSRHTGSSLVSCAGSVHRKALVSRPRSIRGCTAASSFCLSAVFREDRVVVSTHRRQVQHIILVVHECLEGRCGAWI